jgi:hypothetical protein
MTENYSDDRRTFLKAVALISGAAALLPLAGETAASSEPPLQQAEKTAQGYRVTEHIRKYYEAARI